MARDHSLHHSIKSEQKCDRVDQLQQREQYFFENISKKTYLIGVYTGLDLSVSSTDYVSHLTLMH